MEAKATEVEAIIVGAGPAGMAAAISLVKLGYTKVVVIERDCPVIEENWTKAYCYNINHHGIRTLRLLGLEDDLTRAGVLSSSAVRTVRHTGKVIERPTQLSNESYWIIRPNLIKIMRDKMSSPEVRSGLDVRFENTVVSVAPRTGDAGGGFRVVVQPKRESRACELVAPLLIGAEGCRGVVEKMMKGMLPDFERVTVPHVNAKRRHKACRLPIPESLIPDRTTGFLIGKDKARISIYAQPADGPRSLGVMSWLKCGSAEELMAYLEGNWPQVDWAGGILSPELASSFVKSPGTMFAEVQYVTRLQAPSGTGGACLVGDAVHSGPPDLGQGVNACLVDVHALHTAMAEGRKADKSIAEILASYEASHSRDGAAIAKLQPYGVPYQYNQPWCFHKALCTGDLMVRFLGSKYLPSLISKPVVMMLQDPSFSYSQILDAYHATSRNLTIMAACAAAGIAFSVGYARANKA